MGLSVTSSAYRRLERFSSMKISYSLQSRLFRGYLHERQGKRGFAICAFPRMANMPPSKTGITCAMAWLCSDLEVCPHSRTEFTVQGGFEPTVLCTLYGMARYGPIFFCDGADATPRGFPTGGLIDFTESGNKSWLRYGSRARMSRTNPMAKVVLLCVLDFLPKCSKSLNSSRHIERRGLDESFSQQR